MFIQRRNELRQADTRNIPLLSVHLYAQFHTSPRHSQTPVFLIQIHSWKSSERLNRSTQKTTKNVSGPPFLRPRTKQSGQTWPDHALQGPGSYFVVGMHCRLPSTPSCLLQGTRMTAWIKNSPTDTKVLAGWSCFIYKNTEKCAVWIFLSARSIS